MYWSSQKKHPEQICRNLEFSSQRSKFRRLKFLKPRKQTGIFMLWGAAIDLFVSNSQLQHSPLKGSLSQHKSCWAYYKWIMSKVAPVLVACCLLFFFPFSLVNTHTQHAHSHKVLTTSMLQSGIDPQLVWNFRRREVSYQLSYR